MRTTRSEEWFAEGDERTRTLETLNVGQAFNSGLMAAWIRELQEIEEKPTREFWPTDAYPTTCGSKRMSAFEHNEEPIGFILLDIPLVGLRLQFMDVRE